MTRTDMIAFMVGFKHGKKKRIQFNIVHNLHLFGVSLEDLFDEWCADCENPENATTFIKHIKTIHPGAIAYLIN